MEGNRTHLNASVPRTLANRRLDADCSIGFAPQIRNRFPYPAHTKISQWKRLVQSRTAPATLASPYGRGGRAQARTERVNAHDTNGRDYLTNAARPSQSRLRRASSPKGRAEGALATSPHYVILAAQKAPFRVLFVEIIPLFPVPVRPGRLRRRRGGRRRCLWLSWPCPFPYRWRSAPGPGWFFPPPS